MSFLDRIKDTFRFGQQDDSYFEDEDYENESGDGSDYRSGRSYSRDNDEYDNDGQEEEVQRPRIFSWNHSGSRSREEDLQKGMEIAVMRPTSMDEAREIVDDLLDGKAVLLNLEGLNLAISQRIIDFSSGAAYSMNGKLENVSRYMFIITPEDVTLSGTVGLLNGDTDKLNFTGSLGSLRQG